MTRLADGILRQRLDAKTQADPSGCLLFMGHRDRQGYARMYDGVDKRLVHRLAHEVYIGPIAEGLQVDHRCGVRHCVNPAHLEAVTALENTRRAARGNARKTQCRHGHSFTPANTRIVARADGSTSRACRKCDAARQRGYRDRRRVRQTETRAA